MANAFVLKDVAHHIVALFLLVALCTHQKHNYLNLLSTNYWQ